MLEDAGKRNKNMNLCQFIMFTLNLSKNIVGNFILLVPWVFSIQGYLMCILVIILVYAFCVYSFCLIAFLAEKTNSASYSELYKNSPYNKAFSLWINISIIVLTISGNSSYLVFMCFYDNIL